MFHWPTHPEKPTPSPEYERIAKLEGFEKLSEQQKEVVRKSFSQNREHIKNWFCHAGAAGLEYDIPPKDKNPRLKIPHEFFQGEYFLPENYEAIDSRIRAAGFPCLVHLSLNSAYTDAGPIDEEAFNDEVHTFVVFGEENGELMTWGKEGLREGYALQTLREMLADPEYAVPLYWNVRPLRAR